jgi:carbamoyltransferase
VKRSSAAAAAEMEPVLGKAYDPTPDVAMLSHVKPDRWIRHRTIGSTQPEGVTLDVCTLDEDRLIDSVVEDIAAGRVVGWHQGRLENGPRALGNRSILLDPSNLEAAGRLSRHVKARAAFRPYALSVAEEDSQRLFESDGPLPRLSRWMQTTAGVRDEQRPRVAAALHVDGTTRPQVCRSSDNGRFHRLLLAYGRRSGVAALLNTSLNDSGFPLSASPTEALLMFARTDMDVLVVNDTIIRKRVPS